MASDSEHWPIAHNHILRTDLLYITTCMWHMAMCMWMHSRCMRIHSYRQADTQLLYVLVYMCHVHVDTQRVQFVSDLRRPPRYDL